MSRCRSRVSWAPMFAWGLVLLAPLPTTLAVRCIKSADNGLKECEGTFCAASYYVHSVHGEMWQYDCIDDAFGFGSCINPYVRYEQNHIDMVVYHIFRGCCSSDWCSNDTEALTMPVEYQEYFNSLNPSSPVEPIPSRSVPEHETELTTPLLPPDPSISITWLPSEVSVTTVTVVSQSRGTDAAVSPCDTASTTASTSLVQPSSTPSSGDMYYATLSLMLIIVICFLVCVILVMFVGMALWWAIWYRKLKSLTNVTEFKLQIE